MWKKLFSKSPKKSSDPVQDPPGCVSGRSIDDLVARTRVHDGFWEPSGFIGRQAALEIGTPVKPTSDNGFPIGKKGYCWDNSLSIVAKSNSRRYCLGFAAGYQHRYEPHAWISENGLYYEVSPQTGKINNYILVYEEPFQRFEELSIRLTGEGINVAPMIDIEGKIIICKIKKTVSTI